MGVQKVSLRAGGTAPQRPSPQDGVRAVGLLKRAAEQLPPGSPCAGARLVQVPRATEQHHLHWFHQGKNRPMTSQDLFKTGEENAFFTDIMKHISTEEDREGVLPDVQRLQSYYFHRAAMGESPRAEKRCPPQFCLCFSMRSRAHSPSPLLMKHGSDASAPQLFRKSTQQLRDHLG